MRARERHLNVRAAGANLVLDARRISGASDGSAVSTWNDESGNGHNASQAIENTKPIYKTSIQGGGPVLRFNNSALVGSWSYSTEKFSIVLIFKRITEADGGDRGIFTAIGSSGSDWSSATGFDCESGGGTRQLNFVHQNNQYRASNSALSFAVWTCTRNGANQNVYYNGNVATLEIPYSGQSTFGNMTIYVVGSRCANGAETGTNGRINADFAYVIWLPFEITAAQRKRIERSAGYSFKIACS